MSRIECLGKSSTGSQKQLAVQVSSAYTESNQHNDKLGKRAVSNEPRKSHSACSLPCAVQVSCKETQKSGSLSEVLNTNESSQKESSNITPRVEEQAQSIAVPDEELNMKDSAVTGGMTHVPPATEPFPMHGGNGEEEETEEEDVEGEELKAPVELILKFLRAVMDKDFQLSSKLCQMILVYEQDNPEASEFLPLIKKKLLEDQEAEQSTDEEEEDDDEDDDEDDEDDNEDDGSGSDEESSQSSSCSSSSCSSSSSDDDEEEEKRGNRHKPCPPCIYFNP